MFHLQRPDIPKDPKDRSFGLLPRNRVALGYNDLSFYDSSSIASNILWYQLIPRRELFSASLSTTYIRVSTLDIITSLIIRSSIIFQKKANLSFHPSPRP
jgi:hypothetical protein